MKKTLFRETDVCTADQKLSTFMKADICCVFSSG